MHVRKALVGATRLFLRRRCSAASDAAAAEKVLSLIREHPNVLASAMEKDHELIGNSLGLADGAAADFALADKNSDGVVDEKEFMQWHLANKFQGLSHALSLIHI